MKEVLKKRAEELECLKQEKLTALATAPSGFLRISHYRNRAQYYKRENREDRYGRYLRKDSRDEARALAQKDYDHQVLSAAEKELNVIYKFLSLYPDVTVENVYDSLHEDRKNLVVPIIETTDEFVKRWCSVEYERKMLDEDVIRYRTTNGELVRSKSEWMIANMLKENGVPYRYEYPLYLRGMGTVHPDFCVLNIRTRKEYFWEHLGMMDNVEYVDRVIKKIAAYQENGFFPGENLILTYETRRNVIDPVQVRLMMDRFLK